MCHLKMMISVLFLFMALSSGINAQNLTDLMFMPGKGKVVVGPSFSLSTSHGETSMPYSSTYNLDFKFVTATTDFSVAGYYGFTDNAAFGLSEGYSKSDQETSVSLGGLSASETYVSKGMTDPSFMIKFRPLSESVILDLTAGYSPKLFKNKIASDTQDGTQGKGCHTFDLGAEAGQNLGRFSYVVGLYSTISTKTTAEDDTGTSESTGGQALSAGTGMQYMLSDAVFFRGNFRYAYQTKTTETDSDGAKSQQDGFRWYLVGGQLGLVIVPERTLLNIGVTYVRADDMKISDIDSGETYTLKKNYSWNFEVSAMFKF